MRHRHGQRSMRLPLVVALGVAALGGCTRPAVEGQGRRGEVMAGYTVEGLSAKLPATVSVLAVRAAAEAELRGRGYVITDSTGSQDRASIRARGAGEPRSGTTEVSVRLVPRATQIDVDPGWLGDEASARALLDGVLRRLGR